MNFNIIDGCSGLKVIERKRNYDKRGCFEKLFCEDSFREFLDKDQIMQINYSHSKKKGTVRGMHFRKLHDEQKIVSCVRGSMMDVVVDLRRKSNSFLKVFYFNLSESNNKSLFIPKGFAHGWQALQNEVTVIYLHTKRYEPENEIGFSAKDSTLRIKWPQKISLLSDNDLKLPELKEELFV